MGKITPYTIVIMSAMLMLSFSKHHLPSSDDHQRKVQAAVDSVRLALSEKMGIDYPYINVLIQTPGEQIFVSSAAAGNQPLTADTYYRFASTTKNFTSAAILNMYEDGWLDYKAKIASAIPGSDITYVPATPEWNFPHKQDITIEQLLQHSAGVFDVDNDSVPGYKGETYTDYVMRLDSTHQFTTDEMVSVLTKKNLSYFTPGNGYHYSNTGYSILAKIIARVYSFKAGTNKTYDDYMQDYIVGGRSPVPVHEIHFPVLATEKALPNPHVTGAYLLPDGIQRFDSYNMSAQVGEGNGYGTMNALNTYIRSLMKGKNVLKPATVQLMQTDRLAYDSAYALGCTYRINLGFGHNGARIGYLSQMAYDPVNDISVVSMVTMWDLRKGTTSFLLPFNAIYDAAYAARKALGYPGKP
ncbi:serine hydrolase domain-containing protein [Danxiaibacter flavus]|uniref:Serine hydrolase domain-containing protein n=1 Tax=Danxiaibacter flavus TaxID=3049108 RepID=A0ABV3ZN11_9BACT|nr:serine hydrolase domain-containing protein [Chitinophagaceae bacterium DXS]